MTATATTPDPDCHVCSGSGLDPVFFSDCTECWPDARLSAHREELWHARRQHGSVIDRSPPPVDRAAFSFGTRVKYKPDPWDDEYRHGSCLGWMPDHPDTMRVQDDRLPTVWQLPATELRIITDTSD